MTVKPLIALGALSTLALATAAFAQAPAPAAAPAAAGMGGPPVTGVCTYVGEAALLKSQVGMSTMDRLKQIAAPLEADIQKQATDLETEQKALQGMTKEQLEANAQRVQAFNQKRAQLERQQQIDSREIELTKNKQFSTIANYLQPIIGQIATSRSCGLILERTQVAWANPQMDITDAVIAQLNQKVQALPAFERERVDPNTGNPVGASAGAAPRAAAATPAATTAKKKK